jgi:hypothetical protein
MDTDVKTTEEEPLEIPVVIEKLIPPVYSRQLKLFGFVIWSDTRQLDEEAFYQRISDRVNNDLAKELLVLKANK